MKRRTFFQAMALSALTCLGLRAEPAQHPARRYLVRGTLQSISSSSLTVNGHDRHDGDNVTRALRIDSSSKVEQGLKVGDQVVADYNHTFENNVFVLISVRRADKKPQRR